MGACRDDGLARLASCSIRALNIAAYRCAAEQHNPGSLTGWARRAKSAAIVGCDWRPQHRSSVGTAHLATSAPLTPCAGNTFLADAPTPEVRCPLAASQSQTSAAAVWRAPRDAPGIQSCCVADTRLRPPASHRAQFSSFATERNHPESRPRMQLGHVRRQHSHRLRRCRICGRQCETRARHSQSAQ